MTTKSLAREIVRELEGLADPERVEFASRSFPTAQRVIGVTVPKLREVVRARARALRKAPAEDVVALARELAATGVHEARKLGYEVLAGHKGAMAALTAKDLEVLAEGNDDWVSVDNFGGLVAGPVWREGRVPDGTVRRWARSKDRWWRRTAVVATVALNQKARGGTGDPDRTLDICRLVASDRDDMVAKSLSWALRELAKVDAAPVVAFLEEHEHELPARVLREVRKKIETGRK
jgi:3-methyladenine DNA glycosylase AlkD